MLNVPHYLLGLTRTHPSTAWVKAQRMNESLGSPISQKAAWVTSHQSRYCLHGLCSSRFSNTATHLYCNDFLSTRSNFKSVAWRDPVVRLCRWCRHKTFAGLDPTVSSIALSTLVNLSSRAPSMLHFQEPDHLKARGWGDVSW